MDLVFPLICCFHRSWAYSSKSTVRPKMESCFQDGACFVCFLLQIRKIPWSRKWQPYYIILSWKIPWTKKPGGLLSMGSLKVRHDQAHTCAHTHTQWFLLRHHSFYIWILQMMKRPSLPPSSLLGDCPAKVLGDDLEERIIFRG